MLYVPNCSVTDFNACRAELIDQACFDCIKRCSFFGNHFVLLALTYHRLLIRKSSIRNAVAKISSRREEDIRKIFPLNVKFLVVNCPTCKTLPAPVSELWSHVNMNGETKENRCAELMGCVDVLPRIVPLCSRRWLYRCAVWVFFAKFW